MSFSIIDKDWNINELWEVDCSSWNYEVLIWNSWKYELESSVINYEWQEVCDTKRFDVWEVNLDDEAKIHWVPETWVWKYMIIVFIILWLIFYIFLSRRYN